MHLECSDRVEAKLAGRGLTLDDVRDAVASYNYTSAKWIEDARRERRLSVTGVTKGRMPVSLS